MTSVPLQPAVPLELELAPALEGDAATLARIRALTIRYIVASTAILLVGGALVLRPSANRPIPAATAAMTAMAITMSRCPRFATAVSSS